jgi:Flp pilus assembly protein TadG
MFRNTRSRPHQDQLDEKQGCWKRFWRNARGSAAIEFSMIAPAFFAMLFPMFEIGITFSADAVLQNAVNDAARQIRTGAVQTAGLSAAGFRQMVCDELTVPLTCDDSLLKIDVRTGTTFPDPLDENGEFRDDYQFTPGGPSDVVVVRALYKWTSLTPCLGNFMDSLNGSDDCAGEAILQATAAFRNEPY